MKQGDKIRATIEIMESGIRIIPDTSLMGFTIPFRKTEITIIIDESGSAISLYHYLMGRK